MTRYPCEPTPFETMFGSVMMCRKCGHGPAPKECRESAAPEALGKPLTMLKAALPAHGDGEKVGG